MTPVLYSRRAKADLDEIFDYIAADNPARALTYVEEIQEACEALESTPLIGVARPDLRSGVRILPLRARIVIAYEPRRDQVRILRVFRRGRDWEAIIRQ